MKRGHKLHLAFFCADPETKKFTTVKVRAWTMDFAWLDAADKMRKAGWPEEQKMIFLGHVA